MLYIHIANSLLIIGKSFKEMLPLFQKCPKPNIFNLLKTVFVYYFQFARYRQYVLKFHKSQLLNIYFMERSRHSIDNGLQPSSPLTAIGDV